jgi:hypothetical protein
MVDDANPRLLKALRELSQERELRIRYQRSAAALKLTNERLRDQMAADSASARHGAHQPLGRGNSRTR